LHEVCKRCGQRARDHYQARKCPEALWWGKGCGRPPPSYHATDTFEAEALPFSIHLAPPQRSKAQRKRRRARG